MNLSNEKTFDKCLKFFHTFSLQGLFRKQSLYFFLLLFHQNLFCIFSFPQCKLLVITLYIVHFITRAWIIYLICNVLESI